MAAARAPFASAARALVSKRHHPRHGRRPWCPMPRGRPPMAPNNPSYAPRARAPRTHAASNAARLAARLLPLRRASQAAHAASGAPRRHAATRRAPPPQRTHAPLRWRHASAGTRPHAERLGACRRSPHLVQHLAGHADGPRHGAPRRATPPLSRRCTSQTTSNAQCTQKPRDKVGSGGEKRSAPSCASD